MRFTIRDLLWLMVVVALGVAWWIDRDRLLKTIDELDGFQTLEEWLSREDEVPLKFAAPAKDLPGD